MPLTDAERSAQARHAITTRWAKTTDKTERQAATLSARVAAAVKVVVDQAPALSNSQKTKLRAILTDPPKGGDDHARAR
jgi:hypothetical protein